MWSGREGWCGLGCSVGESLLIVRKEVIWVGEDGGCACGDGEWRNGEGWGDGAMGVE